MNTRALIAALVLSSSGVALAQQQAQPLRKVVRSAQKFAVAPGGAFVLENPVGNIDVVGADVLEVEATIVKTLTARTQEALDEAAKLTDIVVGGDPKTRIVRLAATAQPRPWSAVAHWSVRVPRNTAVRIISSTSQRIRVHNVNGHVRVRNFNGSVVLTEIPSGAIVESVNGSIAYATPHPRGHVILSTLNGHVTATLDRAAGFRWNAETATGDIRTNLPVRGAFFGKLFRGTVNAPGGPTLTTTSLMGDVHLLASGGPAVASQSIRRATGSVPTPTTVRNPPNSNAQAGGPRVFQRGTINGAFSYTTNVGDVKVAEVRGEAVVKTGAGEVQLGMVTGACDVRSEGGPLQLGEVLGILNASTRAGDIFVDSTRRGSTISTQGGTIRLLYAGGPARLTSGGGDIIVRQAGAAVTAETTSGDISLTLDPTIKSETVNAKTGKGNVMLYVDPKFGADVDATIITSDPNADTIASDIPGLSIIRTHIPGGKTRVRATGKINGGGQRVTLHATDGDIRITGGRLGPTVLPTR
ncbi:MAG TPA: DUF4097 family beta strand repeat-containing protein [Thermoanaerobaculia bacterium]|nr:DUF4097 family beta strand repeat-containing protein [Thermoanaerobaculia bacterium]